MEHFKYRLAARFVSLVQLGLLTLFLICLMTFTRFDGGPTWEGEVEGSSSNNFTNATRINNNNITDSKKELEEDHPLPPPAESQATKWKKMLFWFIFLWLVIFFIMEYTAAVKLFKATATEVDLERALIQVRFWLVVMYVFTPTGIIGFGKEKGVYWGIGGLLGSVVINGTTGFLVTKYKDELEVATGAKD